LRSPQFCNIYVRGLDDALYARAWDGSWHEWKKLDDTLALASDPVDSMAPHHEHIFVLGEDRKRPPKVVARGLSRTRPNELELRFEPCRQLSRVERRPRLAGREVPVENGG
jgi:hypothetical protein